MIRLLLFFILIQTFVKGQAQSWVWNNVIGGNDLDFTASLAVALHGDIVIGGTYSHNVDLGDVILPTNGYNEVFLIRYNSDGELIWAKHFGTDNFEGYPWEAIGKMDVTNDNKIIIFGMPVSYTHLTLPTNREV